MIQISIIVPTKNRVNNLSQMLHSCIHQSNKNFEIIIVSSSDKIESDKEKYLVVTMVKSHALRIKYKRIPIQNKSEQCNTGLLLIDKQSKYFAIVDDDCLLKNSWINTILQLHYQYPNYLVIGGGYTDYKNTSIMNIYINSYVCGVNKIDLDSPFCIGGNISFKIHGFKNQFKFNKNYSVCEDWAISQDIIRQKRHILLDPKMNIYHNTGRNIFSCIHRFIQYGYGEYFIILHYPGSIPGIYIKHNALDAFRITKHIPELYKIECNLRIKRRSDYRFILPLIILQSAKIIGLYLAIIQSCVYHNQYPNQEIL